MSRSEAAYAVTVIHAGCGRQSTSRCLAERLLAAVRDAEPAPLAERVLLASDLMPSIGQAISGEGWSRPLLEARDAVAGADGVIAVSPIVHGAYSGPFKSFVDLLGAGTLAGKPVLIAASGGTQRHCLALEHVIRPLFVCLRCVVAPTAVYAASEECGPAGVPDNLGKRIERAARELTAMMEAPRIGARPTAVDCGA